jgi:hypothetical protein
MLTVPACKAQQFFFDCLPRWLANPDDILPDISHIPNLLGGYKRSYIAEIGLLTRLHLHCAEHCFTTAIHQHNTQKELVAMVLLEQRAIGWDLCFCGYLSRHWVLAVAACLFLPTTDECPTASLDAGKTWPTNPFPTYGNLPMKYGLIVIPPSIILPFLNATE